MSLSYFEYHLSLLEHLRTILHALGEAEQIPEESHQLFLQRFDQLAADLREQQPDASHDGQDLIVQVFHRYPQIAHLVPRDLLWFFAGDCLHYMPDDEIDLYQRLDEQRFAAEEAGEAFDWDASRRELLS